MQERIEILSITLAAPVTGQLSQVLAGDLFGLRHLAAEANFVRAGGGTTCKAWLQTSLDGGTNWVDIANFAFTTSSARLVMTLNAETSVASYTPLDAALGDNAAKDGILGDQLRVKYTTTGTYTGASTLTINIVPRG